MKKNGFTLIELLVVIAIIGVLASVIIASLNTARAKARDARRLEDAREIFTAVQAYYNDKGSYPIGGGASKPNNNWSNSGDNSWNTLATELQPYIASLPKDPSQQSASVWAQTGFSYSYYNCIRGFMLVYHLENANGPDNGTVCNGTAYRYGGTGASTAIKTIGSTY